MKRKADNISNDDYENNYDYNNRYIADIYIIKPYEMNIEMNNEMNNDEFNKLFIALVDSINNSDFNISS